LKSKGFKISFLTILLALFTFTFFYQRNFALSYYSTQLRILEILLGVLLFYSSLINDCLVEKSNSYFIKILIGISWFCIFAFTVMPFGIRWSPLMILPIMFFVSLIILFQKNSPFRESIFLNFFIYIGKASYSIYLYHWVVLVLAKMVLPYNHSASIKVFLLLITFLLGLFSFEFIENVFKIKSTRSRTTFFVFSFLFVSISPFIITRGDSILIFQNRSSAISNFDFKTVSVKGCSFDGASQIFLNHCMEWNSEGKSGTIVVWGDSFANSWMPVFLTLAKQNDLKVIELAQAGCPPLLGVTRIGDYYGKDTCHGGLIQSEVANYISKLECKHIFVIARWSLYLQGLIRGGQLVERALIAPLQPTVSSVSEGQAIETFSLSLKETKDVLLQVAPTTFFLQTPTMPLDVSTLRPGQSTSVSLSDSKDFSAAADHALASIESSQLTLLDPAKKVCLDGICRSRLGRDPLYVDESHPSDFLAMLFLPEIRALL
jgi:hypothetical protein